MTELILPPGPQPLLSSGWTRTTRMRAMPWNAEVFLHHAKQLSAIRGREMGRWHLSVAHKDRIPTWGELGFARDHLLPPDVWLMIAHPPREYWLNVNSRVLHFWEFRDAELIEQFKMEGEIAQGLGLGTPDDGEPR